VCVDQLPVNNPPSSQITITTGHFFNVSPLRAKRWHVNRSRILLESPMIITIKTHSQCNYARTISRSPTCDQSITRSRERMSIERCGSHERPFCVTTFRVTMIFQLREIVLRSATQKSRMFFTRQPTPCERDLGGHHSRSSY